MDSGFAPELDNFSGAGTIKNMMAGPMLDKEGNIRGVVQLFNKHSCDFGNSITSEDKTELNCILTSLGELVKAADLQYQFMRICTNLGKSMGTIDGHFDAQVEKEFLNANNLDANMFQI